MLGLTWLGSGLLCLALFRLKHWSSLNVSSELTCLVCFAGLSLAWLCLALFGFDRASVLLCSFMKKVNSEEKINHGFITSGSLFALALIMPWPCFDHALGFLCLVLRALFA